MQISVMFGILAEGMVATVLLFAATLLFALPLGLFVSFGRMSKNAILRGIVKFYISVMRGTPLVLQLMMIYFGPFYIFHVRITANWKYYAVVISYVLNYAAYFAEIYRAGIESIPRGQYEAAQILGYSRVQTFIRIILPQVIKRVIPPVTNETITLVKDTSLAFTIGIAEMFTQAKAIASSQTSMIPYAMAAVFYFIFNFIVAFLMERFEKKLSYYR